MNDYKIKNILESLKEEVENGKVSLREAAVELHKAGWTNFIDIDATRNLLKTRNVTGNGNVPGVSDMMGKYREMKTKRKPQFLGYIVTCVHFPKRGIL